MLFFASFIFTSHTFFFRNEFLLNKVSFLHQQRRAFYHLSYGRTGWVKERGSTGGRRRRRYRVAVALLKAGSTGTAAESC